MNDKEFNKVDWINIIIHKGFQDYFDMHELENLSMLSKLTRAKLNLVLFKSIRLSRYNVVYGARTRIFCVESFRELSRLAYTDGDEIQKDLNIQKSLSDINFELQDIKHLVNSIFMDEVRKSGDYLYPILNNFLNLSVLKFHRSTIQYSIFQKLGEYFPMLKTFELYYVVLSKEFTDDNVNSNETVFPFNLSCLSICCIEITDLSISSGPYRHIIDIYEDNFRSKFALPNISLPSLKELEFFRCSIKDNGLEEFLETNPNLEQLSIDTFSPGMSKYFNSLKSLHIYELDIINNLASLITHKNIKTLKITIENNSYYDKFKKLCSMCPSVEHLYFNIWDTDPYQSAIDTYLVHISKKLPNLKTIELPISGGDNQLIDINQFPKIEKIIFEIENGLYFNVYFENHRNLKEIEFRDTCGDINKEKFLEKFKNYNNWRFRFYKRKVKGYKIKI